MSLSDPEVRERLAEGFELAWHNQLPALYCNDSRAVDGSISYPQAQLAAVREGAGGGNLRFYFCDPEGRVVHMLSGYWEPARLLEEADFARRLLEKPAQADAAREQRRLALIARRDAAASQLELAQQARLLRSLDEAPLGQDIEQILRQVEDDIYLKGAVGCDS